MSLPRVTNREEWTKARIDLLHAPAYTAPFRTVIGFQVCRVRSGANIRGVAGRHMVGARGGRAWRRGPLCK